MKGKNSKSHDRSVWNSMNNNWKSRLINERKYVNHFWNTAPEVFYSNRSILCNIPSLALLNDHQLLKVHLLLRCYRESERGGIF